MFHGNVASVCDEFYAACMSAAIVERPSVGRLLVTGADRLDLLHRLSTNDLLKSKPPSGVTTVFTTEKGRIVDCARVLTLEDSVLLITSTDQETKLKDWIDKYIIMEDVLVENVTPSWSMFSLVGPEALAKGAIIFFGSSFEPGKVTEARLANKTVMIDCRREQTLVSLDIHVQSENASEVGEELMHKAELAGIGAMSHQAHECLRIFHGIPWGPNELVSDFNPYEVGLGGAINFEKGCYIGQEVIARLDTYNKIRRKLVRLNFREFSQSVPLKSRLAKASTEVGRLTSISPVSINGDLLALGVVDKDEVLRGDTLSLMDQSIEIKGIVTETFDWKRA